MSTDASTAPMTDAPDALLASLPELAEAIKTADAELHAAVGRLRAMDPPVSWAEVGKALGVSRQAAWERFAKGARP